MIRLILHIAAAARVSGSAAAQLANAPRSSSSGGRTLLWATGGAVLGGLAGAVIGAGTASDEDVCRSGGDPDGCLGAQLLPAIWGTGIGITLGAPVGAHFGNRRGGQPVYTALTSLALFAGEVIALNALIDDRRSEHKSTVVAIAVTVPVLQIIGTTLVERALTPRAR